MPRELILSGTTLVALVDDEDFYKCDLYDWFLTGIKYNKVARRFKSKLVNLSNHIKDDHRNFYDHKDRNFLNNQKDNLRICTLSQNMINRDTWGKSQYKGVYWSKKRQLWEVSIQVNNKREYLGGFKEEIAAAEEYNKYAIKLHGEFAVLNKIGGVLSQTQVH